MNFISYLIFGQVVWSIDLFVWGLAVLIIASPYLAHCINKKEPHYGRLFWLILAVAVSLILTGWVWILFSFYDAWLWFYEQDWLAIIYKYSTGVIIFAFLVFVWGCRYIYKNVIFMKRIS